MPYTKKKQSEKPRAIVITPEMEEWADKAGEHLNLLSDGASALATAILASRPSAEQRPPYNELLGALEALSSEARLRCVVAGTMGADGRRSPLCPEILTEPQYMCAGCRTKAVLAEAQAVQSS